LLLAQFRYVINMLYLQIHLQLAGRCTLWRFNNGAENFVLQELQFSLMLALNSSLWIGNTLINVLKALASIIFVSSLHAILLSKITPRYFT
jgi:hypothetical protein